MCHNLYYGFPKADPEIRISVQVVYLGDNPRKLWGRSREEKAAVVYVNEQATAEGNWSLTMLRNSERQYRTCIRVISLKGHGS